MSVPLRFDSLQVGQLIPELAKTVQREDVVRYAEVSTDKNPLHLDDDFAKGFGFNGMIAHGMFTLAHMTTCLTDWVGDPSTLRSVRASFRSAVEMGDTIVAGGSVKALDTATKTATLEVWVRVDAADAADGDRPDFAIKRSSAVVQLP